MAKSNPELDAAWAEYERLDAGRKGKPGWLDDDYYAHFAKCDAAKAEVDRLEKHKNRPATLVSKPMTTYDDIPPPPDFDRSYYQFQNLQINHSFVVAAGREHDNAKSAISAYKRRHSGWNYVGRSQADGTFRFWRTA